MLHGGDVNSGGSKQGAVNGQARAGHRQPEPPDCHELSAQDTCTAARFSVTQLEART